MARATQAQWAERVERWRASGLTAHAFARKHRLSESSLRWWKWRLQEIASQVAIVPKAGAAKSVEQLSPLTFVEVTAPRTSEAFEVVLVSGVAVKVPTEFEPAALGRLLDVLERRR